MIKDYNIVTEPRIAADIILIRQYLCKQESLSESSINDLRIIRRSIDARQRNVKVNLSIRVATDSDSIVEEPFEPVEYKNVSSSDKSLLIVGAGPAGLFAALRALEYGAKPVVLERGKDVDERRKDIAAIGRKGVVNSDSNYCFGEGGAGTYSDGKLFTRSKKRGNVRHILNVLRQHGASPDILIDAHPHIGSDKLPVIIKNIRQTIIKYGGEVHFNTRVNNLIIKENSVKGVISCDGRAWHADGVVLATGHSARDVYRMLDSAGVELQSKGFTIGVRLEHPQQLIDKLQYHNPKGRGQWLPAAEYNFVEQIDGRGVYSFCMCPGGVIVPAVSADGESVVNGMSSSARGSKWANSGMVVEIRPGDFPEYSVYGALEMLHLQESLEKSYYDAAGHTLKAPAQRMSDFVNGKVSVDLPASSYAPGLLSLPVHFLLPKQISSRLQKGLKKMGAKCHGFLTPNATLVGLESRTSSPIRIPRDNESMEHVHVSGLYPAGEGAGYAGGIVSAAVDGERCVDAFMLKEKQSDQ